MKKHLFVLCPPYSGSTVLWKLLATSPHVSAFEVEGQFLDCAKEIMREDPWNPEHEFPWEAIKKCWDAHWDTSKGIFLEKSPPNLVRAARIEEVFRPSFFVLMIRDPYAVCEGHRRRNGTAMGEAARLWLDAARLQRRNAETLQNTILFTYEEMTEDPGGTAERLLEFMPELEVLDAEASFRVHSVYGRGARKIENLNRVKIEQLSERDVAEINAVLGAHRDLLERFGYRLLETAAAGPLRRSWIRAGAMFRRALDYPARGARFLFKRVGEAKNGD